MGVGEGLLELPQIDPYDALAGDVESFVSIMLYALQRVESSTHFGGALGCAPHSHMEKAFAQRREQIRRLRTAKN
jgi:hypothetical protein